MVESQLILVGPSAMLVPLGPEVVAGGFTLLANHRGRGHG